MNISTFSDDLFELIEFAERLEKFIETEQEYVDGSLVIALSSKYGSGKTTFLKMWKNRITSADENNKRPLVISLNAWESDYYGDPLFSIVSAIIDSLSENGVPSQSLLDAAKDVGWFTTAIGSQVANRITGIDAVAAGDFTEKKKKERQETSRDLPDSFSTYLDRKKAMKSLKKELEHVVRNSSLRVLFLVDELDRCRPDYAISYLGTIKHIFDIKGAIFVLAADRHHLENSAKTAFGLNLDFEEYYRKFIHREVTLPQISKTGYERLASKYLTYYLEKEGLRNCFMALDRHRLNNISELIGALKLTPRQTQEVFRILGHTLSTSKEKKGRMRWTLAVGSIAMVAFKVGEPRIFSLLGSQQFDCKEAADYLVQLMDKTDIEWWFLLFVTGGGLHMQEGEKYQDLIERAGFTDEQGNISIRDELATWEREWGYSKSAHFSEIRRKIEQISQWD